MRRIFGFCALLMVACATIPAWADDRRQALVLLEASQAKWVAAKSATADTVTVNYSYTGEHWREVGRIACLKPNYLLLETWVVPAGKESTPMNPSAPHRIYLSDGKTIWNVQPDGTVTSWPTERSDLGDAMAVWLDFYLPNSVATFQAMEGAVAIRVGTERMDDRELRFVETRSKQDGVYRLYFNSAGVMCGVSTPGSHEGRVYMMLDHLRMNAPLSQRDFVLHLPSFARPPTRIDRPAN